MHHARNDVYVDRNYGGIFILWDRLFGTFVEERDEQPVVFGVRKPLRSWNPFWANFQVYEALLFDAVKTARWGDKLRLWFARTGWRPEDVARHFPERSEPVSLSSRFDPPLETSHRYYALLQFVVAAGSTLFIGWLFAAQGISAVLLPCVALWVLLYSVGRINEGDGFAFERYRLLLINPVLLLATQIGGGLLDINLVLWVFAYTAVSLAGLFFADREIKIDIENQ